MGIDHVGLTDSGKDKQIGEERRGEKNGKTEGGGEITALILSPYFNEP